MNKEKRKRKRKILSPPQKKTKKLKKVTPFIFERQRGVCERLEREREFEKVESIFFTYAFSTLGR